MGTELELKLVVDDPSQLDALLRSSPVEAVASGVEHTERLRSVYFDTPDHVLARNHTAIRVRFAGTRRIQTVKTRMQSGSGHARGEWEANLANGQLDLTAVPEGAVRTLLDGVADRLTEVFETEFDRTTRRLRLSPETEVELAIDRGEVRSDARSAPIREAELELKSGDAAALFDFARRLHETVPFRLEQKSKAARGYALHSAAPPAPADAEEVALAPDLTTGQAFLTIAAGCARHLAANEACARAGVHARGVHQMRVATRRLSSAITLLRDFLPDEWTVELTRELRWLTGELADAREWDVFLAETLPPLRKAVDDARFDGLAAACGTARERAYERVRAALRAERYTQLLLALGGALERPLAAQTPVLDVARDLLNARQAKLRKAAKKAAGRDAEWLHRLRIRFKKLRYATEFLGSLFGQPRRRRRLIDAAKALQDALGRLNDMTTTPALLATLPDDAAHAFGRGAIAGWQAARVDEAMRALPGLLADFRKIAPITS